MPAHRGILIILFLLTCLPALVAASELPDQVGLAGKSVVSVTLQSRDGQELATATGFIVSEQGIVATSYSVVSQWQEPTSLLLIKTFDGTDLRAEQVIASDAVYGIALLRTSATPLPALRLRPDFVFTQESHYCVAGGPAGRPLLHLKGKIRRVSPRGEGLEIDASLPVASAGSPVLTRQGDVVAVVIPRGDKSSAGGGVSAAVVKSMLDEYRALLLSRAWFELGLLYDAEKVRAMDSAAAFREATRIDPDYIEAYNNLSVVYGKAARYEESVEVLQHVLRLRPDFPEAKFNLGIAYMRLGRYPEAAKAFRSLLAVSPDDADAHYLLAVASLGMKKYDEVRKEREVLSTLAPLLSRRLQKQLEQAEEAGRPGP